MKTVARVRAVGGSLMVRIPKDIAKEENIRPGELVEIDIAKPRKSGFGLLKGMRSFTQEDELKAHD